MQSLARMMLVAVGALAVGGCSLLTGPDGERVVGAIQLQEEVPPTAAALQPGGTAGIPAPDRDGFTAPAPCCGFSAEPVLEVPDTVAAGQAFDVVVRTYGRNGCWRGAGADVAVSGDVTTITPYDVDRSGGKACTQATVTLPRLVRLSVSAAGEHLVRLRGRGHGPDGFVSVERRILVQ